MPSARPFKALFQPQSVAVLGSGKEASLIQASLSSHYVGRIFKDGDPGSPTDRCDLAVIAGPAAEVPRHIEQCLAARTRAGIVLAPVTLEPQLRQRVRQSGLRLLGPESLGVLVPRIGLAAGFSGALPETGTVAFLSQSAGLCAAVLDWSLSKLVGFSAFVSTGWMNDIPWWELLQHFGDDPLTRSVVLYLESVGEARSFLSAAREVVLRKPVIVIEPGVWEASGPQVIGSADVVMAGKGRASALNRSQDAYPRDAALEAAFRRCGVLRVENISDVFHLAEVLGRQTRPRGPRLTIVTNAGGPGKLAASALLRKGGRLAGFADSLEQKLQSALPQSTAIANPLDLLGDADATRYREALEAAISNPETDGTLVILTPQAATEPLATAQALVDVAKHGKPVLASWMGAGQVAEAIATLNQAGIPTFPYPDTAARAFDYLWQYSSTLRSLYETPSLVPESGVAHSEVAHKIADHRHAQRTLLKDAEAIDLLKPFGLASDEAPPSSPSIPLALSSFPDARFGPVMRLGLGGPLVAALPELAVALPPLTTTLARRWLEQMPVLERLASQSEGSAEALDALIRYLVLFSNLVVIHPEIQSVELDLDWACREPHSAVFMSRARIALFPDSVRPHELPRPAVRPYPHWYEEQCMLRSGEPVRIRPIRPEDEPLIAAFHTTLSETTVYRRYFSGLALSQRVAHERLTRVCFIDYDREMALVAEVEWQSESQIIGVTRFIRNPHLPEAEFALVISDSHQRQGLGTLLLSQLESIARKEHLTRLVGYVLPENTPMVELCRRLGYHVHFDPEEQMMVAEKHLADATWELAARR
jgi:acyl-CoA synthetase (NDP forming)/RimJ/RimL family protein N-acetyltransferase